MTRQPNKLMVDLTREGGKERGINRGVAIRQSRDRGRKGLECDDRCEGDIGHGTWFVRFTTSLGSIPAATKFTPPSPASLHVFHPALTRVDPVLPRADASTFPFASVLRLSSNPFGLLRPFLLTLR